MKEDYAIIPLHQALDELKMMLLNEHQVYAKRKGTGHEWTGEDFAQLYYVNLALLEIVQKQNQMINNIYDILDRHESGLG